MDMAELQIDGAPSIPVNPRSRANPRVSLRPVCANSHASRSRISRLEGGGKDGPGGGMDRNLS